MYAWYEVLEYSSQMARSYSWCIYLVQLSSETGLNNGGYLLWDSAYPLRPCLMTPVRNPANAAETQYNAHHRRARSIIECTFGKRKNRWRCLHKEGRSTGATKSFSWPRPTCTKFPYEFMLEFVLAWTCWCLPLTCTPSLITRPITEFYFPGGTLRFKPEKCCTVIVATAVLHNIIMRTSWPPCSTQPTWECR